MLLTPNTSFAGILEIQDSNAISKLPAPLNLSTNLNDLSSRFMRWDHWQACRKLALQNLEVRVAEASCIHLYEEIMLAARGYSFLAELIRLIVLHFTVSVSFFFRK